MTESKLPKMILVFDTETSGLIPWSSKKMEEYPYVLQLSFILYDVVQKKIVYKYNKYIKPPDNVIITQFITDLTGINRELCNKSGVNIVTALHEFYQAYKLCDAIVAHNIQFDIKMLEVEIIRNYAELVRTIPRIAFMFNTTYNNFINKQTFCTMLLGKNICNILVPSKTDPKVSYKKNPKLEELYEKLFQEKIANAHDAYYDTVACLRCFVSLKYNEDLKHSLSNN